MNLTRLRDIEANLNALKHLRYHLGSASISRSSLARLNQQQPAECYEALFYRLYHRCAALAPKHGFRLRDLNRISASTQQIIRLLTVSLIHQTRPHSANQG